MFIKKPLTSTTSSKFELKHHDIALIADPSAAPVARISLAELETMRSARRILPASRHALEIICGGSCETGAQ